MTNPAPVAPVGIQNFGPGLLTVGAPEALQDVSSLVNSCSITPSTDTADSTTKLSGWVRGGSSDTTWTLSGNIDTDAANQAGLWQLAFDSAGAELPFQFIPQYGGPAVTGIITVTPLPLGADEYGKDLTADFEWNVVGKPVVTREP